MGSYSSWLELQLQLAQSVDDTSQRPCWASRLAKAVTSRWSWRASLESSSLRRLEHARRHGKVHIEDFRKEQRLEWAERSCSTAHKFWWQDSLDKEHLWNMTLLTCISISSCWLIFVCFLSQQFSLVAARLFILKWALIQKDNFLYKKIT